MEVGAGRIYKGHGNDYQKHENSHYGVEKSPLLADGGKYDIVVIGENVAEPALARTFSEPASLRNADESLCLLVAVFVGVVPDVHEKTCLHVFRGKENCHDSSYANCHTCNYKRLFREFRLRVADPEHKTGSIDRRKGGNTSEVAAPPLEEEDGCHNTKKYEVFIHHVEPHEPVFVLLLRNGAGAGENQQRLDKFRRLDGDEAEVYPHSAAAGKEQDDNHKYADARPYEFTFILDPPVIAAEQETKPARNEGGDAGYEMLETEVNLPEAGLKNNAHIYDEQEHEVHGICPLPEKGHGDEVDRIESEDSRSEDENVVDVGVISVGKNIYHHRAMSDQDKYAGKQI